MNPVALAKLSNDPSTKALWDPWKVLDMYPKNPDFSCVGVAMGGSRCRWKFWRGKWAAPEADLELMSTIHPSQITKDILTTLARHSLCADNHQYQAYEKVKNWSALIVEYLKVVNVQLAPIDELRGVKTELEELRKQGSSPSELASLRGKVLESKSTIQALRESEMAKANEIISLGERLAASDLTRSTIKDTERARTQAIKALKEKCAVESDRIRTINDLYEEYKHSNTRLRTERDAKEEDLNRLRQDLWNIEAELEENQRAQRSKGRENENLRQQLNASNARIEELQAITVDTRSLHQKIEDTNKALTESNRLVSHLQQEVQRLKTQKHFRTFRDHVRLLAKQKNYERTATENQTLLEQASKLTQRLEEADMQLAAQDVSNTIAIVRRQQDIDRSGTANPILLQTQKRHQGHLRSCVYQTASTIYTKILQEWPAVSLKLAQGTLWPTTIKNGLSYSSLKWCFLCKLRSGFRASVGRRLKAANQPALNLSLIISATSIDPPTLEASFMYMKT